MTQSSSLTAEQIARIEATLSRLRAGLAAFAIAKAKEPAVIFVPEAYDDRHS